MYSCKLNALPLIPTADVAWRNLSSPHDAANAQNKETPCDGADNGRTVSDLTVVVETQRAIATSDFDLATVMQLVCERAKDMTHASGSMIGMPEGDRIVYKATSSSIHAQVGSSLPIANSISGLCVTTGQLLLCHDTESDSRVNRQACRAIGIGSLIVLPLMHQGKTIGVLKLISDQKNFFEHAPVDALELLAGILSASLSNKLVIEANRKLNRELQDAVAAAKQLNGVLPMCCECKKIRDDSGFWKPLEIFIADRSELRFSHGYCPQCAQEFRKEAGLKSGATE